MGIKKYLIAAAAFIVIGIFCIVYVDKVCGERLLNYEYDYEYSPSDALQEVEDFKAPQMFYENEPTLISLGEFKITYYCPCESCCGIGGGKTTASGTTPAEGRTCGADWNVLPPGTEVLINDNWYTVEDRGAGVKGNWIDIFVDGENAHQRALEAGVDKAEVFVWED